MLIILIAGLSHSQSQCVGLNLWLNLANDIVNVLSRLIVGHSQSQCVGLNLWLNLANAIVKMLSRLIAIGLDNVYLWLDTVVWLFGHSCMVVCGC